MRFVADGFEQVRRWLDSVAAFYEANPTLVGLAVLGVMLLVGAWLLVRWIRRPMGARFLRVLAQREEVAVLMHPNPDPDAMACAAGVALLAEQVGTRARLQYAGQIRHQENRAFRTVLDLEMERIDHVDQLASPDVVLVDHNRPRGFEGADELTPYAVIDHHPGGATGEAFTDCRIEYGACATILAEYCRDLGGRPRGASDASNANFVVPSAVSTGLLYGILSDTKHMTKGCTEAEFESSSYLYTGVDEDDLDRIANPQVGVDVLEAKAQSIWQRDVRGSFAVSDVGTLSNADAIPQAAEELMSLEGITAVVVYGKCNGTLHVSGRSRDDRVHMGETLEVALGNLPGGTAGGHARMGGGQVPLDDVPDAGIDDGDMRLRIHATMSDRLFRAMNGEV